MVWNCVLCRFYGPGFGAHPVGLQSPGCLFTVRAVHLFFENCFSKYFKVKYWSLSENDV